MAMMRWTVYELVACSFRVGSLVVPLDEQNASMWRLLVLDAAPLQNAIVDRMSSWSRSDFVDAMFSLRRA
jgi:hypothetical protein